MEKSQAPEVSAATRAKMQANTRTDTKPETMLRSALHARGLRFRKDYRIRLGYGRADPRPDIAFTRQKVAVFVDGCFWHGCPTHGHVPKTNSGFWAAKFERNQRRDIANDTALAEAGWAVVRIWEHVDLVDAIELVVDALDENQP